VRTLEFLKAENHKIPNPRGQQVGSQFVQGSHTIVAHSPPPPLLSQALISPSLERGSFGSAAAQLAPLHRLSHMDSRLDSDTEEQLHRHVTEMGSMSRNSQVLRWPAQLASWCRQCQQLLVL
jgi:hypothetical protein